MIQSIVLFAWLSHIASVPIPVDGIQYYQQVMISLAAGKPYNHLVRFDDLPHVEITTPNQIGLYKTTMKNINNHSQGEVAVSMKRRTIFQSNYLTNTKKQNRGKNYDTSSSPSICCWMDYNSIEAIEYIPSINNKCHDNNNTGSDNKNLSRSTILCPSVASFTTTEIFINRLQKEIIVPFQFTLLSQIQLRNNNNNNDQTDTIHDAKHRRQLILKRIIFGYNDVSKLLFNSTNCSMKPSLIVLVNEDGEYLNHNNESHQHHMNASMVQHIPTLAYEMNVPLLLLPSSYSDQQQQQTIRTSQQLASIFCHNNTNSPIKRISIMAFTHHNTSGTFNNSIEYRINNTIDSFVDFIHGKT